MGNIIFLRWFIERSKENTGHLFTEYQIRSPWSRRCNTIFFICDYYRYFVHRSYHCKSYCSFNDLFNSQRHLFPLIPNGKCTVIILGGHGSGNGWQVSALPDICCVFEPFAITSIDRNHCLTHYRCTAMYSIFRKIKYKSYSHIWKDTWTVT